MTRSVYDPKTGYYWQMQPLAVRRAVLPLRNGPQGELRHAVRCLLIQAMGLACDDIPLDAQIPHHFSRSRFTVDDKYGFAMAAHDGLRELGYDAAADMLADKYLNRDSDGIGISIRAKEALENLEAGPPSIRIGDSYNGRAIFTHTIKRFRDEGGNQYVVGRAVNDPSRWYRFIVGAPVHSRNGTFEGWDPDGGFTFQRCGRTLADVRAPLYGSAELVPGKKR